MKKCITLILLLMFILTLAGCEKQPNNQQIEENINTVSFEAVILEVFDASVLVCPVQGSNELKSADKISVSLGKLEGTFDFIIGQTIRIEYDGLIAESYPAQIFNVSQIELVSEPENTQVFFNGKWFDKSKLSEATLRWLELSNEERWASSYYPADLMNQGGWADLDNRQEEWGIELQTKNVTPGGLSIVCEQYGGENVFELNTGSYYVIQKLEETGYVNVENLPQEYDVAWTAESWIINKDATTIWDVNWEWLYGKLPAGEYRIGKEIMNFRGPGDFDQEIIYAHFEIQADYGRELEDVQAYLSTFPQECDEILLEGKAVCEINNIFEQTHLWESFLAQIKAGNAACVVVMTVTVEGDPILYYVHFDGTDYMVVMDTHRDHFGTPAYVTDKFMYMSEIRPEETSIYHVVFANEVFKTVDEVNACWKKVYALYEEGKINPNGENEYQPFPLPMINTVWE